MKLYSYVVDHDRGYAPNPEDGLCTLVYCKFSHHGQRRNIVETAEVGDWVLGTGGQSSESSGNGTIIYLMRVDEKLAYADFLLDPRFHKHIDNSVQRTDDAKALISNTFYYFGNHAPNIPIQFRKMLLEKRGPGYRADLSPDHLQQLIAWFQETYQLGKHGEPCSPPKDNTQSCMHACASSCEKSLPAPAEINKKYVKTMVDSLGDF
ncbi:hypothetical protein LG202_05300 [Methylobacillus methanolivorans]